MEILRVEDLVKTYGKGENQVNAVDHISFSIDKGEFVAIVGASGSGKSTLLHLLGGVDRPTSGKVFIDGKDIYSLNDDNLAIFRRRQIGLIYQFYNLIPILNVRENITLPCDLDGQKVDEKRLDELIKTLGLEKREKHLPNQLSGGQQQRVSIGRAMINNPALMLADEPGAAICDDSTTDAEFVGSILHQWAAERGIEVESERFASADAFLFRYAEDKSFDLLLLDVEMPGTDGVTLAKTVRQENEAVQIVFITGYSDYIAEGYDVAALHYLVKPVSREKLFAVLDRAWEKHRRNARCLNLELSGELVRLPLYEVRYLDVHQNYVTVHARQDYTVKRTLGEFEAQLDEGFLRVGRGMILNLKQIRRVTKKEVVLADGTALPLPRGAYEPLNRAIIERT